MADISHLGDAKFMVRCFDADIPHLVDVRTFVTKMTAYHKMLGIC